MKHRIKYILGLVIILGVFIYLMSGTFSDSLQYYLTVHELIDKKDDYRGKQLKVAGIAGEISISSTKQGTLYSFEVIEEGDKLQVEYEGFVPDTFKTGAQVVVTGILKDNGVLEASEILAKCASKYEAKVKE
ncbi:MAG: hypothetical protein A2048_09365 [Deltaproteobacteria bacterium GWA2_45_12]|nr:MAG: hypothetical protein A2048_09365 [Deltaproteobacteria bacterium GWA2_45_12]